MTGLFFFGSCFVAFFLWACRRAGGTPRGSRETVRSRCPARCRHTRDRPSHRRNVSPTEGEVRRSANEPEAVGKALQSLAVARALRAMSEQVTGRSS